MVSEITSSCTREVLAKLLFRHSKRRYAVVCELGQEERSGNSGQGRRRAGRQAANFIKLDRRGEAQLGSYGFRRKEDLDEALTDVAQGLRRLVARVQKSRLSAPAPPASPPSIDSESRATHPVVPNPPSKFRRWWLLASLSILASIPLVLWGVGFWEGETPAQIADQPGKRIVVSPAERWDEADASASSTADDFLDADVPAVPAEPSEKVATSRESSPKVERPPVVKADTSLSDKAATSTPPGKKVEDSPIQVMKPASAVIAAPKALPKPKAGDLWEEKEFGIRFRYIPLGRFKVGSRPVWTL